MTRGDDAFQEAGARIGALALLALVAAIVLGWAVLIFGLIAILIDLRSGSKSWRLSLGTLVVFGLLTAINVS